MAWAIRCIKEINPKKHIDISSKISFNVLLSAFYQVDFYDYRPARIFNLSNLNCKKSRFIKIEFSRQFN